MAAAVTGLALVAVLAAYVAHAWSSPFVYEDWRLMAYADQPVTGAMVARGRGLTTASWALLHTPRGSHLLNLALHLLVIALVWVLVGRLETPLIRNGVAAIVALHPLTVETVAYAAARAELLAALGVLGALLCVTARSSWGWLGVLPCLALAYLGKETGIVACALVPLVLWRRGDHALAECVGWIGIGVAAVVLSVAGPYWAQVGESLSLQVDGVQWALAQAEAIYRLVVLSVVPLWLSVSPAVTGDPWLGAAAVVLLAGLLELAWRARHQAPLLTFGLAWIAIVAAPRLLVRTPGSVLNEHQWYLAMPGVACVLVAGLALVAAMLTARLPVWRVA